MLTGLGGKIMTYDGENRPLSVTYLGKRTCYVCGVDGKRLKKVEGLPPAQDCTALPANVNATVYFGAVEVRNWKVAGQEQVLTYPHPAIKLLNGTTPAAATYLHRDGLSSVRAITDAAGVKIESALYKPFGEQSEWVLPGNAAPETKGWIGERYDADAGLQYLNARYYDPDLSLFLQPDWFEVTKAGVGTNRFSYSFNDPVNGFDPNGNETCNADGNGCRPDENDPPPCEDSGNCDHSGDWIPTAFDIAVDFIPIIGDAKGIYEAEGVLDTLGAVASAAIGPFGDAIKVARKLDKAANAASKAQNIDASKLGKGTYDVTNDGKVVPNPYGKKGSPQHQAKADEVRAEIEARGLISGVEEHVRTPQGSKRSRFADVFAVDPQTGLFLDRYQIGRQTRKGIPVARERRALDDIEAATGMRPTFVPYNLLR